MLIATKNGNVLFINEELESFITPNNLDSKGKETLSIFKNKFSSTKI